MKIGMAYGKSNRVEDPMSKKVNFSGITLNKAQSLVKGLFNFLVLFIFFFGFQVKLFFFFLNLSFIQPLLEDKFLLVLRSGSRREMVSKNQILSPHSFN